MSLIPNLLPQRGWVGARRAHPGPWEAAGYKLWPWRCQQVLRLLGLLHHSGQSRACFPRGTVLVLCPLPAGAVLGNADVGALLGTVTMQREAWLHCMPLCMGRFAIVFNSGWQLT